MTPLVKKYFLKLKPPSDNDKTPDLERVLAGLLREGISVGNVPVAVVRKLPEALRANNFEVTATVSYLGEPELIDVEPGERLDNNFGLAVDLGTTNIVCSLIDLNTGVPTDEASETNPQTAIGEDILARIHHCLNPGGLEELRTCGGELRKRPGRETRGYSGRFRKRYFLRLHIRKHHDGAFLPGAGPVQYLPRTLCARR